ncbi:MAG: hypothetical protein ACXACF_00450 [Candidatus Hermodarchaeia archaeon]
MNPSEGEPGRVPLHVIVELLSSLTSPDAIKIFMKAATGIRNSTHTIQELGLTQKRYYVWLKRLIDAGLVEKQHGRYRQTLLGRVCAQLGRSLQDTLLQGDRLDLADTLLTSTTLSAQEKTTMLRALSTHGSQGLFNVTDILHSVKTIVDYDIFIEEVIKMLEETKKSAYLATNKTDLRVEDTMFKLIDRDTKVYALTIETTISDNIEMLKIVLNPASRGMVRRLLVAKEMNLRVLKHLSYGFIVSDEEQGIIEMPHPLSQEFYLAFKFTNPYLCKRLIDIFQSLYKGAKEDPRIDYTRITLGLSKTVSGKRSNPQLKWKPRSA